MNVREILMRGFMLHVETSLKLPEHGLVVVTGPNGAGKSSIIEGVAYGGWGESLRGTPPWSAAPGELVVVSDRVRIERGCKDGKKRMSWCHVGEKPVKYENATKAEEALEAVIGPFDVWRRTHVFSSHDAAHFTMASDGERKRLLECVLGLHRFDAALDLCRDDRHEAELSRASIATRVQQLQARRTAACERLTDAVKIWTAAPAEVDEAALMKRMADLEEKVKQALEDHRVMASHVRSLECRLAACASQAQECERRRVSLEAEKQSLVGRLDNHDRLEACAKDLEALTAMLGALDTKIAGLRQKRDVKNAALMKWHARATAVKLAHERARLDLETAEKAVAGLSAVPCGGEGKFVNCCLLTGAIYAKFKLADLKKILADAEAAMAALGETPEASGFDETGMLRQRHDLAEKVSAASSALVDLWALREVAARVKVIDGELALIAQSAEEKDVAELKEQLGLQKAMLEELQEECDTLRQRKAEVEATLRMAEQAARQRQVAREGMERAEAALADVENSLAKDENAAREVMRRLQVLTAVEQVLGLKGVRAHVLGRALSGIEQAANSWLLRFGLDMSLELKPYTEKKTGGVSDAISLMINGAGGGYGYKGASGGQRRRIDVALLLALADVASAAQGRAPGTLFLDEVFDALDQAGVDAVCGVLEELARERAVVVITHSFALIARLRANIRVEVDNGKCQSRML